MNPQVAHRSRSPLRWLAIAVTSLCSAAGACAQTAWTASDLSSSGQVYGVIHSGANFVAVTGEGEIYRSADGATWLNSQPAGGAFLQAVTHVDGSFYAVGAAGTILRSTDAVTWVEQATPTDAFLSAAVGVGKSVWVVGGAGTVLVGNAGGFRAVASGSTAFLSGIAFGSGKLVAVGGDGMVIVSADRQTWTPVAAGTQNFLSDVCYSDGLFVAVGQGGTVLTSADASTWTVQSSGTTNWLNDVAVGNGEFVAVGDGGTVIRSTDGVSWAAATSGVLSDLTAATFGGGRFVAAGETARWSSANPVRPGVSFAVAEVLFEEGANGGSLALAINRSGDLTPAISVSAEAFAIEATSGADFTLGANSVSFAGGQASADLLLTIPDDLSRESIETLVVELRDPSVGTVLGETPTVCVAIHDPGDSDGDFLPDAWEIAKFEDLTSNSATDDPDFDGNDNLREFEDGTEPTSAASALYRVNVIAAEGDIVFVPDALSYAPGSPVAVILFLDPQSEFQFVRWEGEVFGDPEANPATVIVNSDIELVAVLSTSLEKALDLSGVVWSSSGAAEWIGQTGISYDGVDAAEAGAVGAGGVSELYTTITGPDMLRFRWKSDFADAGDLGRVLVDGQIKASITGQTGWTTVELELPAAPVEVRFTFQRAGAAGVGSAFWVDDLVLEAAPPDPDSFEAWRVNEFTSAELAIAEVSGAGADPEGDGLDNVMEYLLGLQPKELDAEQAEIGIAAANPGRQVTVRVVKARLPFVELGVEGASDFASWSPLELPFTTSSETEFTRTLKAVHASSELRFGYRLTVALPAP